MENIQGRVSSWNTSIINKVAEKTVRVVLDKDNRMEEQSFLFPKAVALFDLILEKLGLESFTFTAESVTNYLTVLEYNSLVIKFTKDEHIVVINSLKECQTLNLPDAVKCRIDLMLEKLNLMDSIAEWVKTEYETSQPAGRELNTGIVKDNNRDPFSTVINVKVDADAPKDAATFLGISKAEKLKNCKDMTMEQFAYSVAATQGTGNSCSGFKVGYIQNDLGVYVDYKPSCGGVLLGERRYVINNDKNSDNISVTQTTFFEAKPAESISSLKSVKWSVESKLVFSKTKLNAMLELYKNGKEGEITLKQVNELITSRELTKVEELTLDVFGAIKTINKEAIRLLSSV
jgi:hypothetical protein